MIGQTNNSNNFHLGLFQWMMIMMINLVEGWFNIQFCHNDNEDDVLKYGVMSMCEECICVCGCFFFLFMCFVFKRKVVSVESSV